MRGIEVAFFGTAGKDPELRTSKTGNPYLTTSVAVTTASDADGKPVTTWVRATCFGETARLIAATVKKGDRVYVEGSLTLSTWATADGERRTDLQVAAWKMEKLGQIGLNKAKRETGSESSPIHGQSGPSRREAEFDDSLPF